VVTLRLTLTDRATNKVLFSRIGAEFRERYEISIDPTAYFDESGTAMQRVSSDVARSGRRRHSGGVLNVIPGQFLSRVKKGPAPAAVLLLGPKPTSASV